MIKLQKQVKGGQGERSAAPDTEARLLSLSHIGVRAPSLEDWARLGPQLYGLQLAERTGSTLRFRMDDRRQRIVVHGDGGQGAAFLGFEIADGEALAQFAARLEAREVAVERFDRALADERRVTDGIAFLDPCGNRLEVICGAETADTPFRPGRAISGFRTGALGVGHVVINVPRIDDALAFYRDVLGLRLSDYILRPFKVFFMHLNARHHSVALIERDRNSLHHLMIETLMLDDVGQGYDLALRDEGRIAQTLGRHVNDLMTSFYTHTPSGFFVEYGWGGRSIEPESWSPSEVVDGPSMWGHDRLWLPEKARETGRMMALDAAARGVRAPVLVQPGNYVVQPGACPWFDEMRGT
jgi:2,3-dihydroxybiphenyl 1,2-dioxygenase